MSLRNIARTFGGEVTGRDQLLVPGPGHSPEDRSLSIRFVPGARDGFIVNSFANDNPIACRDYVKARLGIADQPQYWGERSRSLSPSASNDNSLQHLALGLWEEAQEATGSLVVTYLCSRGLVLPSDAADAIRFHPVCPFKLKDGTLARLPALGLMRDVITNEPRAIHRTALRHDGSGKSTVQGLGNSKKMLGPSKGCAIKLSPDEDVLEGLGLVEGIETGLAVLGTGWSPVWVAGSAGNVATFPVLSGVESLTIFADADRAGFRNAETCQERWLGSGNDCPIIIPPADGDDWADVARAA